MKNKEEKVIGYNSDKWGYEYENCCVKGYFVEILVYWINCKIGMEIVEGYIFKGIVDIWIFVNIIFIEVFMSLFVKGLLLMNCFVVMLVFL